MNFSHSAEKHLEYCKNHGFDDELDWNKLSENPKTIEILKDNPNKINWYCLSMNEAIFI